jgi:hypothetical protein
MLLLTALGALATVAAGLVALPGVARAAAAKRPYYVSLGDSYSVGYQPGIGATAGYTGYVAKKLHLTLANFGCGGATTTSITDTVGCPDVLPHTAGVRHYPDATQAAAAEAFLASHRGHRRAAVPKVRIIGLTYPDVILGEYVCPSLPATAARLSLASLSVTAFKSHCSTRPSPRRTRPARVSWST